jgi:maltose/moltooligosaccharide transporter
MGSRSYDWLNYPTYNWLFFRQDLDKIRTKKTLLLAGAILASAALFIMPSHSMVCSRNVMDYGCFHQRFYGPFRAFVGDNLPENNVPWDLQSFFIGIGAYFASKLPLILLSRS